MVADSTASTSTPAAASPATGSGSARKRVRKRSKKSKSTNAEVAAGESSDDEQPSTSTATPSKAADVAATLATKLTAVSAASSSKSTPAAPLAAINPHKPSFITRPTTTSGGRKFTLTVAIPGSIVLNAQSPELQSRLAAHIARACAIFSVDEIVVFDEGEVRADGAGADLYQHRHNQQHRGTKRRFNQNAAGEEEGAGAGEEAEGEGGKGAGFDPHTFLARVLQYLETPQYLRKSLFPMHRDLRLAGLMPPLDCPHHLRFEDESEYREGVTIDPPHWARRSAPDVVYVNVGLRDPVEASLPRGAQVATGTRVTVKMPYNERCEIVSPREPVEQLGWYWGYTVRLAGSLSGVLTESPFEGGYDLVVGTSERGSSLTDLSLATSNNTPVALPSGETVPPLAEDFSHAIIVFGGLSGLELAVEQDKGIKLDRHTAKDLFDAWVNVVENQGSRTVRTEEAIMIALARMKPLLDDVAGRKR